MRLVKTLYHSKSVFDVVVVDSRKEFYSGGAEADIDIWDLTSLNLSGKIRTNNRGNLWAMLFLEHKEWLVAGFYWGKIGVYDVNTKQPVMMINTGYTNYWIYSLAYDYKKNWLYVPVHEEKIVCWELKGTDAELIREFSVPGDPIKLELVNQGNELLFTSGTTDLYSVDLNDEKLKIEVKLKSDKLKHIDSIYFIPERARFILSSWYSPKIEVYSY